MTDNMRIWDAVSKTNPAHTKAVNQRGGFTAINANSQIMEATRQFGPIGIGWGYINGDPIFQGNLIMIPVTVWHGDRANTFGPVFGCEEWIVKDRVDSDAPKKAGTDGLTKCLSQLGFNADVFLGLYDDQKYVNQVRQEFAEKTKQDDKPETVKVMEAQIFACNTKMELKAWQRDHGAAANATGFGDYLVSCFNTRAGEVEKMGLATA